MPPRSRSRRPVRQSRSTAASREAWPESSYGAAFSLPIGVMGADYIRAGASSVSAGRLEIVPATPWPCPASGLPAPEEMHCQAENKRTEDPPEEVRAAPQHRADA